VNAGVVVALIGEFDLVEQPRLREAFAAAAVEPLVIVDFQRTTYIDSTVLACVIGLKNDVAQRGGRLVLAALSPTVRRLLDVAGLSSFLETRRTVDEILSEFNLPEEALRRVELVAAATH